MREDSQIIHFYFYSLTKNGAKAILRTQTNITFVICSSVYTSQDKIDT